ncbi:MAG: helix-turn-helix domain-containing protein [Bacteroidia bacterium]|nr:helix-turn-helix domain-containing protein [Bacteroidia bacterium]
MEYVMVKAEDLKQLLDDVKYLRQAVEKVLSDKDEWLSTEEVQGFLNCSTKTLYNYRKNGELSYRQRGRKIWYSKKEVLDFLDQHHVRV